MTEIINPADTGATDPAEARLAADKAYFASVGLDPSLVDQAAAKGETYTSWPSLSPDQVKATVATLRAAGVPEERIEAALASDGYREVDDPRSEDQREYDEAFPAVSADQYRPDYTGKVPADASPNWITETHAQASQWAAAIGLPVPIGNEVIERGLTWAKWHDTASDVEKAAWLADQRSDLVRACGGQDAADAELALAAEALAKGSASFLERLGPAVRQAGIVRHLARQAERLKARG